MLGRVTEPLVSAYAGSKGAVACMTRVMQQELRAERNIHVSLVLPWAIDTPIYQRAANFSGHGVLTIFPVYAPERAAAALCALIARPRHEKLIGTASYLAAIGLRLSLNLTLLTAGCVGPKMQVTPAKQDASWGALRDASGLHAITGGWRKYWRDRIASGFHGPG
jgi:NAD(P)-dependent dehydrogenase (short-subunit alcohol dehydrogenase family)